MNNIINTTIILNEPEMNWNQTLNIKISTIIDEFDETILVININNGFHEFVNKTNVNELLTSFDNDTDIYYLFNSLNDMLTNKLYDISHKRYGYDLIFSTTENIKLFLFKCTLYNPHDYLENTISCLTRKINNL